ncbi:MAG: hypothetical protein J7518_10075 [Nocardioidaceae bacterium]|nr:hypothetical protein [Nocardioidaceae bacterium]
MKYVVVRWDGDQRGYWLDPRGYLDVLPLLAESLGPGAASFATDPHHYDFHSERCVKDLWFQSIKALENAQRAELVLSPNASKHSRGLQIIYTSPVSVTVEHTGDPGVGWLGSLLLDEILPTDKGASHELVFTGGTIRILAGDLSATWE